MLQRLFRRDLFMRITAVLLAIILWLQLTAEQTQTSTRTFEVTLAAAPTPQGYTNLEPWRDSVQVTVEGPLRVLERLKSSNLQASVNLGTAAGVGPTSVDVVVGLLGTSAALRVRSVSPDRLPVNLVRMEQESRPLLLATPPLIEGGLRYSVTTPVEKVTLAGPKSRLAQVQQVVLTVDYTVFKQTTDVTLTPKALDAEGSAVPIAITPSDIPVQVRVDRLSAGRTVPVRAEFGGQPLPGRHVDYKVTPATVTVYSVGETKVPDLTQVLTVPIALTDRADGFTQETGLTLPKGVIADPATVKVDVTVVEGLYQQTFKGLSIRVDGVADDLKVESLMDPVTKTPITDVQVVLSGTREAVQAVTSASLQPFVNVAGQGAAAATLSVQLPLPPGVTLVALTPALVTVTLARR